MHEVHFTPSWAEAFKVNEQGITMDELSHIESGGFELRFQDSGASLNLKPFILYADKSFLSKEPVGDLSTPFYRESAGEGNVGIGDDKFLEET